MENQTLEKQFAIAAQYQIEVWQKSGKPLPRIAPDKSYRFNSPEEEAREVAVVCLQWMLVVIGAVFFLVGLVAIASMFYFVL